MSRNFKSFTVFKNIAEIKNPEFFVPTNKYNIELLNCYDSNCNFSMTII